MKTGYALLFALLVFGLVPLVNVANATTYYSKVTILGADGGYTSPNIGVYYYPSSATLLEIFASHYEGYSFVGWMVNGTFWPTAYNPIQISLNIGSTNVSYSVQPVFGTEPHYVLSLTSSDSISIYVNGKLTKALNTTSLVSILGGTTVTVSWPVGEWYDFTSYLVNGTATITDSSFSFTMNGNTSILISESYVPPNTGGTALGPWINYIAPTAVCLILGYGFGNVGDKLGDHGMAGFFIGGGIGLILCASYSLLPVWLVTVAYILAMVVGYLWFKGG